MLDDIGTKVPLDGLKLPPSYLLETSKGNFQAGYILAEPLRDAARADMAPTSEFTSPPWSTAIQELINFDVIERMCRIGQSALDAELNELHEMMDRDHEGFETENDEGAYLGHVNDEYIEVSEVLPCLYWYSQFLIAYSFFEKALNTLSFSFQKRDNLDLTLKDISGQGIIRAKTYLEKVCGVQTPFKLPEWQTAKLLSEVRNAIAHRNGYIDFLPKDKGSLYSRLEALGVELKNEVAEQEDAQIILTKDFVFNSTKVYRVLLSEIGGLKRDFITPKHGLPSDNDPERSW